MLDTILLSALALVLVFEGLMPFAFPNFWRKMMAQAMVLPETQLRLMGLISMILGLLILFAVTD